MHCVFRCVRTLCFEFHSPFVFSVSTVYLCVYPAFLLCLLRCAAFLLCLSLRLLRIPAFPTSSHCVPLRLPVFHCVSLRSIAFPCVPCVPLRFLRITTAFIVILLCLRCVLCVHPVFRQYLGCLFLCSHHSLAVPQCSFSFLALSTRLGTQRPLTPL